MFFNNNVRKKKLQFLSNIGSTFQMDEHRHWLIKMKWLMIKIPSYKGTIVNILCLVFENKMKYEQRQYRTYLLHQDSTIIRICTLTNRTSNSIIKRSRTLRSWNFSKIEKQVLHEKKIFILKKKLFFNSSFSIFEIFSKISMENPNWHRKFSSVTHNISKHKNF